MWNFLFHSQGTVRSSEGWVKEVMPNAADSDLHGHVRLGRVNVGWWLESLDQLLGGSSSPLPVGGGSGWLGFCDAVVISFAHVTHEFLYGL